MRRVAREKALAEVPEAQRMFLNEAKTEGT